jgi:hypothetical protein
MQSHFFLPYRTGACVATVPLRLWKPPRCAITGENPELAFSKRNFSKSKKEMRFFIERALGSYFRSLNSA